MTASRDTIVSLAAALRLRRESDSRADLLRAAGYWPETRHQAARIAVAELLAGAILPPRTRDALALAHRLLAGQDIRTV